MTEPLFEENKELLPLEEFLSAINRPGSYCTEGRLTCPMPLLSVAGAGVVPFPVPEVVMRALIEDAEPAPFGRGTETVLDRSVRDSWQISPERVKLGGKAWPGTFQEILASVEEGLGCPEGGLSAKLHKLLLYEQGGFFAPHRDTEKSEGMVATLVVSLPVAGQGGELVVRHRDRETRVDMCTEDPSELAYAAFYADCEHEVKPVVKGHRLALVFNLVRVADVPSYAPDFSREAGRIADWLTKYATRVRARERRPAAASGRISGWYPGQDGEDATPEKLVWLLEHGYSEAGLSFFALKNLDEAVARALSEAADRAGCALYAAILHIKQSGAAIEEWSGYDDPDWAEMDEDNLFDDSRWLDSWTARDGSRPDFGEVPIAAGEFIPSRHLTDIEPDEQEYEPPTGNEGGSVERSYQLGVLALWPEDRSVDVLAQGGVRNAVNYLAFKRGTAAGKPGARERLLEQAERLESIWPAPEQYERKEGWSQRCSAMIEELVHLGDPGLIERFLADSVLPHYTGEVNRALCDAARAVGPARASVLLGSVVRTGFGSHPNGVIGLVSGLDKATSGAADWDDVLRGFAQALFNPFGFAVRGGVLGEGASGGGGELSGRSVAGLFELYQRLDMEIVARFVAELLTGAGRRVDPYRELPSALDALEQTAPGLGEARAILWRHAVLRLLERSGDPPREPASWVIRANVSEQVVETGEDRSTSRNWSKAECCRQLQAFCDDGEETRREFPAREDIRYFVESLITQMQLDIDCHTERRGNPHKLVCVKNRASYRRRLEQYAEDVDCMKRLAEHGSAALCETTWGDELQDAVWRAERHSRR